MQRCGVENEGRTCTLPAGRHAYHMAGGVSWENEIEASRPERRAEGKRLIDLAQGATPRSTAVMDRSHLSGAALRDQGAARASSAQPDEWRAAVDAEIRRLAATGEAFTADDVSRATGDSPTGSPGAMGARFLAASKRGEIVNVGYEKSQRQSVHAHPIAQWRGAALSS
jgi:hypothetical protein